MAVSPAAKGKNRMQKNKINNNNQPDSKIAPEQSSQVQTDVSGGCNCGEWRHEMEYYKTFIWQLKRWNYYNSNNTLRQMFYCPICGNKLRDKRKMSVRCAGELINGDPAVSICGKYFPIKVVGSQTNIV